MRAGECTPYIYLEATTYVSMHNTLLQHLYCLIVASFLISATCGSEIWRYNSYGGISANKPSISTRRKLTLEYLGSETISWETDPNCCSLSAFGSSLTTLSCNRPGIHKVTLRVSRSGLPDELVTRKIQVRNLVECFDWTAAVGLFTSSGVGLQVWIADQNEVDVPGTMSERSAWLTEQFAILGQQPTLEIYKHGLLRKDVESECQTFNQTLGYWPCQTGEAVYDGTTNIFIKGTSTQLMDCFVRDTLVHLHQEADNFTNAAYEVDMTISATHRSLTESPNADNIAIVVYQSGIFLTEDSFNSSSSPVIPAPSARTIRYDPMNTPFDILHQNDSFLYYLPMETLVGVTFTWHHLAIMTDQSIYFLHTDSKTLYNTVNNIDISANNLVGIGGWGRSTEKAHGVDMDMVIVWTSSSVYLVKSNGTVTAVDMIGHYPPTYANPQVTVIDAALSPFARTLCILAKLTENPNSGFFLFFHNFLANTWNFVTLSISPTDTSLWHTNFLKRAMDSALVWGEQTAVKITGETAELLTVDNSNTLTSGQLVQLVQTHSGEFVFLTSNNMLLYGRASNLHLVQVPLGELPSTQTLIWYDPLDQLNVLKSDGSNWITREIPLRSEVMGALHPNTSCQVLHYRDNMDLPAYYVDKNNQLTLWASLVSRESDANSLKLTVEGTGKIMVHNASVFQYNRNLVQQNLTVVIYHDESFTDVQDYTTAVDSTKAYIRVGLNPEKENLGCPVRRSSVRTVTVDCPPERKIKIKKDVNSGETCDQIETFITHRVVDGVVKETTETYDWSVLGCPVRVRSGKTFTPRLLLYDGERLVEEVPADFIVWEEYDQTSIEYNTSMAQVGCLRKAQTWSEMNAAGSVWTAENNKNCFLSDDSSYDLSKGKYQIFNKSNSVSLTFSMDYNGVYIFSARIIGRDYSFCSLETRFAVQVYDTNDTNNMVVLGISLLIFTSLFMILIGSSYFRFRILTIREQEEEDKQAEEHMAEVRLVRESLHEGLLTPGIFISQPSSCSSSLARVSGTIQRRETFTE